MTKYDPVAEAIKRRASTGACPFCGTPLQSVRGRKNLICVNSDCRHQEPTGPKMRLSSAPRRLKAPGKDAGKPSEKAVARAKRRAEELQS